ncbi:papain-like cysteine protease family protein [Streptomyces sp. NPDC008313]|uniref:papain-like cysteine protease family protein n=1 Tax=Streptomyces sp. NPDC008313 TaxID=3364826 RepID=UPI0036ED9B79
MSSTAPRPPRRRRTRGTALAGCLLATALSLTTASAATAAAPRPAAAGPAAATSAAADGSLQLDITMQAQQRTNWCWAASGATIASWHGHDYSQNSFCDAAFGYSQNTSCPNDQATLANDQRAYDWMGLNPGSYIQGRLSYSGLQNEINAGRPVQTRIQWSSGGGHMEVLYGYDTSRSWVYWGDPWPDDYRYNWSTYGYYSNNPDFAWTHTLYGIGA